MATYKPYKKTANGEEEIKIPYSVLSNPPAIPTTYDELVRIQKQAYTGDDNTAKYFKLASFPVYNSGGNYASFIITGRMGGWQADNMSFVNMILYNRNGEGGGYINVANSAFFGLCDIVMYRETDGTSTAYLKVKGYYTFDINVNTYQATNVYTGTDATPTGTLKWAASANADRLAVSGGVAYVNGFTLPKQIKINGTTHNPNSNGLVDLGTISGGGNDVEFVAPAINNNNFQVFDAVESGYFTGVFRTATNTGDSFKVNINDGQTTSKYFIIYARNQTEVYYELIIYRINSGRMFAKITVLGDGDAYTGATPNSKSDYVIVDNLTNDDVFISTSLASSYQEESFGFIARRDR